MGQAAIPIIMAVVAAGATYANQRQVAKKQDNIAYQDLLKQQREQRKADSQIEATVRKLEGSTSADEKASRVGLTQQQLRLKQQQGLAGITNTGGGDAVTDKAEAAKLDAAGYGGLMNNLFSGIDAANLQRQGEGFDYGDLGDSLGLVRRNSAQDTNIARLRMQGVQPNPWLTMGAAAASAYGGSYGGSAPKSMAGSSGTNPMIANASSAQMPWNSPDYSIYGRRGSGIGMDLGR